MFVFACYLCVCSCMSVLCVCVCALLITTVWWWCPWELRFADDQWIVLHCFYPVDSSGSGVWLLLLLTRLAATTPPPTRELHRQRLSFGAGSVLLLLNTGHCTLMVGRLILDFVLSLSLFSFFALSTNTHTQSIVQTNWAVTWVCVCCVVLC